MQIKFFINKLYKKNKYLHIICSKTIQLVSYCSLI